MLSLGSHLSSFQLTSLSFHPLSRSLYVVHDDSLPCVDEFQEEMILLLLYITIITQLIDISGLVCCCTLFSSRRFPHPSFVLPKLTTHSVSVDDFDSCDIHLTRQSSFTIKTQFSYEDASTKWSTRCKFLCKSIQCCTCNMIGGSGVQEDLDAGYLYLFPPPTLMSLIGSWDGSI